MTSRAALPARHHLMILVVVVLAVAGCKTRTMYDWGDYQDSLYVMWIEPGNFDPADHLRILTEQITETESNGRQVPPGVRAHVAMLYFDAGNAAEARRYLDAEKAAFPESAVFVDGIVGRIGR